MIGDEPRLYGAWRKLDLGAKIQKSNILQIEQSPHFRVVLHIVLIMTFERI